MKKSDGVDALTSNPAAVPADGPASPKFTLRRKGANLTCSMSPSLDVSSLDANLRLRMNPQKEWEFEWTRGFGSHERDAQCNSVGGGASG